MYVITNDFITLNDNPPRLDRLLCKVPEDVDPIPIRHDGAVASGYAYFKVPVRPLITLLYPKGYVVECILLVCVVGTGPAGSLELAYPNKRVSLPESFEYARCAEPRTRGTLRMLLACQVGW